MGTGTFQMMAIVAAVALVAVAGLTFIATAGDSADRDGGFVRHIHKLGHHLHGGGHHHDQMAELIEQLQLTPGQHQRLEKVQQIVESYGSGEHGAMAELHEQLMAQFQQGRIENDEIRQAIDVHVEQIREMAYSVTDELIALVNELDATQREKLSAHLQGVDEAEHGHGH